MLTLLLFGQAPTVEAVMSRFDQYVKRADTLSFVIRAKVNGESIGTGQLRLDRPHRMNLSIKQRGGEMAFILNEQGGLELDRGHQIYATFPAIGRLGIPPFKLSNVLNYTAPGFAIRGTSQGMFPPELKPVVTPKVIVNGTSTDLVTGKRSDTMGEVEVKAWIDSAGRMVKFYSRQSGPRGSLAIEHEYSNYVVNQKIADATFSTRLPLGYSPFELERADSGLPQGGPVPNIQLRNATSGQQTDLSKLISGANAIVVVADPEFPSNAAFFNSLRDVSKKVPDSRLIVIGMRRDAASAKRLGATDPYFDPTGQQLSKLAIPGAPTVLLIDKKGKLAQMFFGFDGNWDGLDKAIARLKTGE